MIDIQDNAMSRGSDAILIIADDDDEFVSLGRALQQSFNLHTAHIDNYTESLNQHTVVVIVFASSAGDTQRMLDCIRFCSIRSKVLVLSGKTESSKWVAMLEAGATDILAPPLDEDLIKTKVQRAAHVSHLEHEVERLRAVERQQHAVVGESPSIVQLLRMIDRVAGTDVNTLICGESGSGKGVMARALHDKSPRSAMPFIVVNCASLPEALLDAELFGIQGSSALNQPTKIGKIEAANGGTLFLDEISDLSLQTQSKLMRFFQERTITRQGMQLPISVDVKVVTATFQDLSQRVAEKKLREDLLHLVGEITINIPPLRDRGDDVVLLAKTFLLEFNQTLNPRVLGFTEEAISAMLTYAWPGNIRELQNKVKSAVIMAEGTQLSASDLALTKEHRKDNGLPLNLRQVREEAERNAVTRALSRAEGNMSQTANLLGISRPTLYTLIEKYSLQR